MSQLAHAYGLLARMHQIIDHQPNQRALTLYANALRSAIDQGEDERLARGIAVCRRILEPIEKLDLEDAP